MRIARIVVVDLAHPDGSTPAKFTTGDVEIGVQALEVAGRNLMLVAAHTPLPDRPELDDDGMLVIADEPRRILERAIEELADLMAVATHGFRTITSCRPEVAFLGVSEDERTWLLQARGIAQLPYQSALVDPYSLALATLDREALSDRREGVLLLAEALSTDHPTSRFRELCRLFERAFARDPAGLVRPVGDFLVGYFDVLGYSRREIHKWFVVLRGSASHADERDDFATAAEVRPVLSRVEFAAYDVLFNKNCWHDPDPARREVWEPTGGYLPDSTPVQLLTHTGPLTIEIRDLFGVYPYDPKLLIQLPADWVTFPTESRMAMGGTFSIVESLRTPVDDSPTAGR